MANNYSFFNDQELFGDSNSEETTSVSAAVDTGVSLLRERYVNEKDGNRYWLYYAMVPIFGKNVKVNFTTSKKDRILYEQIAFIFATLKVNQVPIYMQESSFDGADGKPVVTTRYFVKMVYDEDETLEVKLKPKNESDAGFWKPYIEKVKRRLKREAEEAKAAAEADDIPGDVPAEQPTDKPEKNKKG